MSIKPIKRGIPIFELSFVEIIETIIKSEKIKIIKQ